MELLHNDKKGRPVDDLVLERLLSGLPAVVQDSRHPSFMETVAVETISGVVAKTVIAMSKKGEVSTPIEESKKTRMLTRCRNPIFTRS